MTTVRSRMIHRCTIERDSGGSVTSIGAKNVPSWDPLLTDQPCFLSMFRVARSGKEIITPDVGAGLSDIVLHLPLGIDVTIKDRINGVTNRLGASILDGVMDIKSVLPHHDHLELKLIRVH